MSKLMLLSRQFKRASYGVIAAGFVTLLLTGRLGVIQIGIVTISFIISWRYGSRLADLPYATRTANVSIVAILVILLIKFVALDTPFVTTTVDFFIFVQTIRILFLAQLRHYLQSYLISLFSVLAATVLTFSPVFLAMFIAYLFLATYAMILFTMVSEIEGKKGVVSDDIRMDGRPLILLTTLTTLFVIVSGSLVFLMFPRLSFGFLPSSIMEPVGVTGFSNNVALGEVGKLKISEAVIMRVVVDDEERMRMGEGPHYFRGTAFDHFDGTYWERTDNSKTMIENRFDRFIVRNDISGDDISIEYFLEPTDSRVLFTWGAPVVVEGPFLNMYHDSYETIELSRAFSDKIRYTLYTIPPDDVISNDLNIDPFGITGMIEEYLQVPVDLDPRVPILAANITQGMTDEMEKVEAIRDYLIEDISYDLDPGVVGDDPLADFLFKEQRGYCEHFATAMTIMLRTQRIPARLTTGFLSGEFNEYGSFFIVRASDAHAWVEVYLEGEGWVVFDPTPPAGLTTFSRRPGFRAFIDTLIMRWNIYVVNYEMQDQLEVIEGTIEATERGRSTLFSLKGEIDDIIARIKSYRTGEFSFTIAGMFAIVIIAVVVLIWLLVRFVFLKKRRKRSGIAGEYDRLVQFIEGRGVKRPVWFSHREFAAEIVRRWPEVADDVCDVTDIYSAVRFGEQPETDEDVARVRTTVQRITGFIENDTKSG